MTGPADAMIRRPARPAAAAVAGLVVDALFGEMPALFRCAASRWCSPAARSPGSSAGSTAQPQRARAPRARHRHRDCAGRRAAALGWGLHRLCRASLVGAAIEACSIAVLLAQRSLFDHVWQIRRRYYVRLC